MIFLLQEEITDGFEVFKAWFEDEAIPQIETAGGGGYGEFFARKLTSISDDVANRKVSDDMVSKD